MVRNKLTLEQACRHFIKGLTKRVGPSGRPLTKGTINQYASTVNIVFDFLYLQPGVCRTACGIDRKFYNSFVSWLNSRGTAANTVGKHIKNLKAILRAELSSKEAQQCEFLQRGACPRPEEQIDNIYLTEEEIMRIKNLKLCGTVANVRDTFVLLCYTGCRYSDLGNITAANIVSLNNGRAVVFNQKKTGREVVIPLLPVAEAILMENNWSVPNQVSIQTFNRIIKGVCRGKFYRHYLRAIVPGGICC
ncbi:MAG: site-specific integrase, partial [Paramuribaculum sp.]|nr:site-specific integrase [Paramuribaculum sp.]